MTKSRYTLLSRNSRLMVGGAAPNNDFEYKEETEEYVEILIALLGKDIMGEIKRVEALVTNDEVEVADEDNELDKADEEDDVKEITPIVKEIIDYVLESKNPVSQMKEVLKKIPDDLLPVDLKNELQPQEIVMRLPSDGDEEEEEVNLEEFNYTQINSYDLAEKILRRRPSSGPYIPQPPPGPPIGARHTALRALVIGQPKKQP